MDLNRALKTAQKACDAARVIQLERFGGPLKVSDKGLEGLVSEADTLSEKTIIEILKADFPDIPVYGEEGVFQDKSRLPATAWVVDPLDGTTNYIYGLPIWCISIGLQVNHEVVVGVVDVPAWNRRYSAVKGQGASMNDKRIHVSERKELSEALLATGFHQGDKQGLPSQIKIFSKLVEGSRGVRRAGAAALDLCLVAEGVFDAFWEAKLKPWDTAAGSLMVKEAGGVVKNYEGNEYSLEDQSILASAPGLYECLHSHMT